MTIESFLGRAIAAYDPPVRGDRITGERYHEKRWADAEISGPPPPDPPPLSEIWNRDLGGPNPRPSFIIVALTRVDTAAAGETLSVTGKCRLKEACTESCSASPVPTAGSPPAS